MYNRKRRTHTRRKIKYFHSIVSMLAGLIVSVAVYFVYVNSQDKQMLNYEELTQIEETVLSYKYSKGGRHKSPIYIIQVETGNKYVLGDGNIYNFNREAFEQNVRIGDVITLYVDPNASYLGYWEGEIYEIWHQGECYLSYEQYKEEFEEFQNEVVYLKWALPGFFLFLGVLCAYEFWRKERYL